MKERYAGYDSKESVRRALQRALKNEPDPRTWAALVRGLYVQDVMLGDMLVTERMAGEPSLLERYREFEDEALGVASPPREERPTKTTVPPDQRLDVLSRLIADQATHEPEVREFRRECLPNGLMAFEAVEAWLREQAERDGPESLWGEVPRAADDDVPLPGIRLPAREWQVRFLNYESLLLPDDGENWAPQKLRCSHPIAYGGVLDRLRRVSEALAQRTNWDPSATTTFILTGVPPAIPRATALYNPQFFGDLPVHRLQLDIHPSYPAADLAQLYRRELNRYEALRPDRQRQKSKRNMAQLVEFVNSRPNTAWKSLCQAWNATFPDERYPQWQNMHRDYHHIIDVASGTKKAKRRG